MKLRDLFPFIVMCIGMFMALLDIQIVASSLQDIGGGLSAAKDQISWVQTSYLIAEICMIPLGPVGLSALGSPQLSRNAMASMSGSDPGLRSVSGARLAIVAWPETSAQPTRAISKGTLSQLSVVMTPLDRRVPA